MVVRTIKAKIRHFSLRKKNAIELSYTWASLILKHCSLFEYQYALIGLYDLLLAGAGHPDIDTAKVSSHATIMVTSFLPVTGTFLQEARKVLSTYVFHEARHIRETSLICLTNLMIDTWFSSSDEPKKQIKGFFTKSFIDSQPEVQSLAKIGMTAYLSMKASDELKVAADIFSKNSNILADRDKQKRKAMQSSLYAPKDGDAKSDEAYINTIHMISCLILSTPYDLPDFSATLIESFLRHSISSNQQVKDTVEATIRLFKRSHQDRWDEDFKKRFTTDQLQGLEGAGAAYYFN